MYFKILAMAQAIVLTAALVHIFHLQKQINNNNSKNQEIIWTPNHDAQISEILGSQESPPELLSNPLSVPDIQALRDETSYNHSAALFGQMKEDI
jgi:hypothetical protein